MPSTCGIPWFSYTEVPQTVMCYLFRLSYSAIHLLMCHSLSGRCMYKVCCNTSGTCLLEQVAEVGSYEGLKVLREYMVQELHRASSLIV